MVKKIVISPGNKEAISFFEDAEKRKAAIRKKLEEKAAKRMTAHNTKH
jgi:hypothetical protein